MLKSIAPLSDKPNKFEPIPVSKFASIENAKWIIKDRLPQAELAVIYGEPGCGKTFLALDAAMSIAMGKPWDGQRTSKGKVVYICAEGKNGFKKRALAYLLHHNLISSSEEIQLDVIPEAPDFLAEFDAPAIAKSITNASVIIVDTFSRVMAGGNENSAEDMGHAIAQCQILHKLTGALIILIHHSGKDQERGARGWSGLRGAVDTEIEVKKIGNSHIAKITKQKDGEMGFEWGFDLKIIELGTDDDGDVITSCVYHPTNSVPLEEKKPRKPSPTEQLIIDSFKAFESPYVPMKDLVDFIVKGLAYYPEEGKRDTRHQIIVRAIKNLQQKDILEVNNDIVNLC